MRAAELFEKLNRVNDGTRSLFESVAIPEVQLALKDWTSNTNSDGILIGGLALSYYARPRATTDVDILFLSRDQIPLYVEKFKKTRPSAFMHKETHVEVEVVAPENINVPLEIADMVYRTAKTSDGVKIASPNGLVALKLHRASPQDVADIINLTTIESIDLSSWPNGLELMDKLNRVLEKFS